VPTSLHPTGIIVGIELEQEFPIFDASF